MFHLVILVTNENKQSSSSLCLQIYDKYLSLYQRTGANLQNVDAFCGFECLVVCSGLSPEFLNYLHCMNKTIHTCDMVALEYKEAGIDTHSMYVATKGLCVNRKGEYITIAFFYFCIPNFVWPSCSNSNKTDSAT